MGLGRRAVVLGGSVAGLTAAGAASRHFDEVIVIERDTLPDDAEHRRGVPQSKHPHFLLNTGRRAIESLYPGFEEALIDAGGMHLDPALATAHCDMNGWAPRKASPLTMIYSSRILLERVIRDQTRKVPNIVFREDVAVTGLITENGGRPDGRVTGVTVQACGVEEILEADLVIDAMGRGSSVSDWIAAAGWQAPAVRSLDAKVAYCSRWYQKPEPEDREEWFWFQGISSMPTSKSTPHPKQHEYLCTMFPIESNRVIVTMGSWGHDMPKKVDDFVADAEMTRAPAFAKAMHQCEPLSEVHFTRSTGNKWRRYDTMPNHPLGLVAIGDSICAFNPLYGQGMSSAARVAVILESHLASTAAIDRAFHDRFLREQRKWFDIPWSLAIARDQGYDIAVGTDTAPKWLRYLVGKFSWPIFNLISASSREDMYIANKFNEVFNLDEPINHFVRNPRVIGGLLWYKLKMIFGWTKYPAGDHLGDPPSRNYSPGEPSGILGYIPAHAPARAL